MALLDLHIHSSYSCDGQFSPEELVITAKEKGLQAIALTDHNSVKGLPEFLAAGAKHGVETVPGISTLRFRTGFPRVSSAGRG
ncbi:MAG: PHP domain-containing protein [Limnochordia bacterium]|nr:PHP domain-containing protein [Limnochordia bacterium]